MSIPWDDGGPARYELTVVGSIGAVWRAAVKPLSVGEVRACTILRTEAPAGGDLVDLVRFLESSGLDAQEVHLLDSATDSQPATDLIRGGRSRSDRTHVD